MQVKTQSSKKPLEIKNEGVIFDIYGKNAKRLGGLSVTKAGLVWSQPAKRKAQAAGSVNVKWAEFIAWAQARQGTIQAAPAKTAAPAKKAAPAKTAAPAKVNASKLPQPKAKSKPAAASKKPAAPAKRAASQKSKKAN